MSNLRTALGEGTAEHSQHPWVAFTVGDSWQAEKLHRQAALSGCLERVSHAAGCKNNFLSLMTNLKWGTLDMCTSTARMRARSGDLKLGNVHLGWCAHSWLVCAAVGTDFFFFFCNAKMADLESDQFAWNRNWPVFVVTPKVCSWSRLSRNWHLRGILLQRTGGLCLREKKNQKKTPSTLTTL